MKRRNIWALTLLAISFVWLLTSLDIANAQSFPRLKPIPARKGSVPGAARLPHTPSSWQPLMNQAPSGPNGVQLMIQGTDGRSSSKHMTGKPG